MMLLTATMNIETIISNYGFPILACIAMAYYVNKNNNKMLENLQSTHETYAQRIDDINQKHKEEVDNLSQVINNNTIAITKLVERMENEKAD